jgi:hypothetical protein
MCLTRHPGQGMRKMQVSLVAQLVSRAETVGQAVPEGLPPLDQSPISSIALAHYILNLRDAGIFD